MPNFIEFMNEKQRDPRLNEILYPCYDEKRCKEIINKYEKNEENKAKSMYVCIYFCCKMCRKMLRFSTLKC